MYVDKKPLTKDKKSAMTYMVIVEFLKYVMDVALNDEGLWPDDKLFDDEILDECLGEGMFGVVKSVCARFDYCIKNPECDCIHHAAGPCDRCVSSVIVKHTCTGRYFKAVFHFSSLVKLKMPLPRSDADWDDFMAKVDKM